MIKSLVVSTLVFLVGNAQAENFSKAPGIIATLDMQKALQSVPAAQTAREELEKAYSEAKKQIQGEEAALRKLEGDLQKQSGVLSGKAQATKREELQKRFMEFQKLTAESEQKLQERERKLMVPIIEEIKKVAQEQAKLLGFTHVINRDPNGILVSPDDQDITEVVISQIKKRS